MSENTPIGIEVLVLTYNRAPLIGATLESLLAQVQPAVPHLCARQWKH